MQIAYANKTQRLFTYIIDVVLISMVASWITSGIETLIHFNYENINPVLDVFTNQLAKYIDGTGYDSALMYSSLVEMVKYYAVHLGIQLAITICLVIGYLCILPIFWKNQTLGRMIMKTKVVNKNETEVSKSRIFLRELCGTFIFYFAFGGVFMLASLILICTVQRSLVDYIGNTDLISTISQVQREEPYQNSQDDYIDARFKEVNPSEKIVDDSDDEYKVF